MPNFYISGNISYQFLFPLLILVPAAVFAANPATFESRSEKYALVIDAKGQHVYPGLIDAQTSLGFPSAQAAPRGRRGGGARRATAEEPVLA